VAQPPWLLDIAHRPIGERQKVMLLRQIARRGPQLAKTRQVRRRLDGLRRRAARGDGRLFFGHALESQTLQLGGTAIEAVRAVQRAALPAHRLAAAESPRAAPWPSPGAWRVAQMAAAAG